MPRNPEAEKAYDSDWLCVCGCLAVEHHPHPARDNVSECYGCPRCSVYFPADARAVAARRMTMLRREDAERRRSITTRTSILG